MSPVVISPILVTACSLSEINDFKLATTSRFYLYFYQKELNAVWATKTADINAAANEPTHQYDLQLEVLSEVLTKVKADAAAVFKKEFPDINDYSAKIFDSIEVNFTIPDNSRGNLKVADDGVLSVYPTSILSGATSEKQINYTLSLDTENLASEKLSGSLKFNLDAGFEHYSTSTDNKLVGNRVTSTYGNADMSTILVGSERGGVSVGTKQKDGSYKFDNYNSSNGLDNNLVTSVYGSRDMSTILVGELRVGFEFYSGGLSVGKRQADGKYKFTIYRLMYGLPIQNVYDVYGNSDMSKILVGNDHGVSLGTRQANGSYEFDLMKYSEKDKIFNSVYASADMSEILAGSFGGGLDIGSKQGDENYTFTNYGTSSSGNRKLSSNTVLSTYGNKDLSTILVGTNSGLDVGTKQADGSYDFVNHSTSSSGEEKLADNYVNSISGNADMSTILVGTDAGLDVGTRSSASDPYTFTNYDTSSNTPLSGNRVASISGNSDLSTILLGEFGRGIDISSNLWFA